MGISEVVAKKLYLRIAKYGLVRACVRIAKSRKLKNSKFVKKLANSKISVFRNVFLQKCSFSLRKSWHVLVSSYVDIHNGAESGERHTSCARRKDILCMYECLQCSMLWFRVSCKPRVARWKIWCLHVKV